MPPTNEYLAAAEEAARAAGEVLLGHFRQALRPEFKRARDMVTEADLGAQEIILSLLRRRFPDHAIYAEESRDRLTPEEVARGRVWFVDPLDGTTNFVHGLGIFTVSICLFEFGRATAGVVYHPFGGELFTAVRGEGARLNGMPVGVSAAESLGQSLLATGFAYEFTGGDNTDHVANLVPAIRGLRRLGSASLDLCYVACGRFDGYWEYGIEPWDHAAGDLIVAEAGGRVTNLRGNEIRYNHRGVAATNGRIHRELLDVLARGKTGMDEI